MFRNEGLTGSALKRYSFFFFPVSLPFSLKMVIVSNFNAHQIPGGLIKTQLAGPCPSHAAGPGGT